MARIAASIRFTTTSAWVGSHGSTDDNKVASELDQDVDNLKGVEWEELKKKGYARYTGGGNSAMSIGNACDIKPGRDDFTVHLAYRAEDGLSDAHAADPVLHRS